MHCIKISDNFKFKGHRPHFRRPQRPKCGKLIILQNVNHGGSVHNYISKQLCCSKRRTTLVENKCMFSSANCSITMYNKLNQWSLSVATLRSTQQVAMSGGKMPNKIVASLLLQCLGQLSLLPFTG